MDSAWILRDFFTANAVTAVAIYDRLSDFHSGFKALLERLSPVEGPPPKADPD